MKFLKKIKEFLDKLNELERKYLEYDFLIYKHDDVTFFCLKNPPAGAPAEQPLDLHNHTL